MSNGLFFSSNYLWKNGFKKKKIKIIIDLCQISLRSHLNVVLIWSHVWDYGMSLYSEWSCCNSCTSVKSNEPHYPALEEAGAAKVESSFYDVIIIFSVCGFQNNLKTNAHTLVLVLFILALGNPMWCMWPGILIHITLVIVVIEFIWEICFLGFVCLFVGWSLSDPNVKRCSKSQPVCGLCTLNQHCLDDEAPVVWSLESTRWLR